MTRVRLTKEYPKKKKSQLAYKWQCIPNRFLFLLFLDNIDRKHRK